MTGEWLNLIEAGVLFPVAVTRLPQVDMEEPGCHGHFFAGDDGHFYYVHESLHHIFYLDPKSNWHPVVIARGI